jgi:hypothetical protein
LLAHSDLDEPPLGAVNYVPGTIGRELGFSTQQVPTSGINPLVGVSLAAGQPVLTHRSVNATTAFDAVGLGDLTEVEVSLEMQVANTAYEAGDFVRIYVTDGSRQISLFNALGTSATDPLDTLAGDGFTVLSAIVPDDWATARLVIESSSNSTQGSERYDFDNIEFSGISTPVPGDANGDGIVNRADLAIVASHYGTAAAAAFADGDFNGDERVDLADLHLLKAHYNESPQLGVPVPEVPTIWLAIVAMGTARAFTCIRRR